MSGHLAMHSEGPDLSSEVGGLPHRRSKRTLPPSAVNFEAPHLISHNALDAPLALNLYHDQHPYDAWSTRRAQACLVILPSEAPVCGLPASTIFDFAKAARSSSLSSSGTELISQGDCMLWAPRVDQSMSRAMHRFRFGTQERVPAFFSTDNIFCIHLCSSLRLSIPCIL